MELLGTFDITIAFSGSNKIAAIQDAQVFIQTEMLKAANPEGYGWDWDVPGLNTWRAQGGYVELFDEDTSIRNVTHIEVDQAILGRELIDCEFKSPHGTVYFGKGYLQSAQHGGGFSGVFLSGIQIKGRGKLEVYDGTPCGLGVVSGGSETKEVVYYLGITPGTVTMNYNMYVVQDAAELEYDGVVVATTGGPVSGEGQLTYAYAATPGEPKVITARLIGNVGATGWDFYVTCPE